MEREKLFMNEGNTFPPTWNSSQFGMKIQNSELNSTSEQLPNCFFNPNWENSVDQSDPFESTLSSIVSSPTTSHPGIPINNGENIVLRELIGRLGSICNSGEISPRSFVDGNGNHRTDTYCYTTPLNSPPKLNLSMMDHQIRGNLPIIGNQLPFSTDPEFAERAAKFSCFGGKSFGGINGQTGENESEFPHKLSRVSSSQSFKVAGSQVGFQENKDGFLQEGIQVADKKFSRLSRSSTPEKAKFGDLMEESSVSEQIPGGEIGVKDKSDANAKKRKSIPRGKAKEIPSAPCSEDAKAAAENEESDSKRSKGDEGNSNGKHEAKENGNQKQTKGNSKPIEPPKDYIHVRARRGQATDSHSLAERVRREKISERMKFLQDLVPGCNKVTGKAVMLDEIINYVQSLQRQVEFLSMKLSTVNPRMDFNMEALLSKDIPDGEIRTKGKSRANAKNRKSILRGKGKEMPSSPCYKDAKAAAENEESDSKRSKGDEGNSSGKDEEKENGNQKQTKDNSRPIEPPKDYIHVRARRGQATDSHSLVERIRREKISERMKFLQDLVPGCNKVTGKAVMLDKIINYVQSLQRQVEIFQSQGTLPHNIYPVDTTSAQAFPYTYQSQQGSNIHRNIPNGAETHGLKTASILDFSKRLFCFLFRTCNVCCKFSIKDYEEKAVALTLFRSKLQDLTKRLEASRLTCPLFDTACWARNLERAYFKMWNLYCCGQHPQPSKVTQNNSEFPYDQ